MYDGTQEVRFTYDANGMRKTKNVDGTTYTYTYNGSQLTQMTRGTDVLHFYYDASGTPVAFKLNNTTTYYYVTTLQGDVLLILDEDGEIVVSYDYDAWGKILAIGGSMATTLGTLNPLTYRGYVYDHETGLYYLQSRYYNPEWGRFLNADALVATGQGLLGNNMFAYCGNSPVNHADPSGTVTENTIFAVCFGGSGPNYTLRTSTDGDENSEELLEYLTSRINPNYICPQNGRVVSVAVDRVGDYFNKSYPVENGVILILGTVATFSSNPYVGALGYLAQAGSGYSYLQSIGDPLPRDIEYKQFYVTYTWEVAEYQNGRIAYSNYSVTWVFIRDHTEEDNIKWLCMGVN